MWVAVAIVLAVFGIDFLKKKLVKMYYKSLRELNAVGVEFAPGAELSCATVKTRRDLQSGE